MVNSLRASLTASLVIPLVACPVWADSDESALPIRDTSSQTITAPSPTSSQGTTNPSSAAASASKKPSATKAPLPRRLLGVVVGAVVGTPVCLVRKTIDEEKYGIAGIIGTNNNKAVVTTAGVFWLPFAFMTGTVESPVYATLNSLNAEEPFSKAQFSLSDVKPKTPASP